eukprot:1311798-Ditylum_brightwellii.AAC.1
MKSIQEQTTKSTTKSVNVLTDPTAMTVSTASKSTNNNKDGSSSDKSNNNNVGGLLRPTQLTTWFG